MAESMITVPAATLAPAKAVEPTPAPAITATVTVPPKAADLVKRTVEQPTPVALAPDTVPAELKVAVNLDDITDPAQRAIIQQKLDAKIKLADQRITEKFMALAEERKTLAAKEAQTNQPWTPERIHQLLQDPNFVTASRTAVEAQRKTQPPQTWEGSTEEWSALSDKEKAGFLTLQTKVSALEQNQDRMLDEQEHQRIKTRFPDYNPTVVEQHQRDILAGKMTPEQVKELLWKAVNFDRYVENSYRFGLQDREGVLQAKQNGASTTETLSVTTVGDKPTPQAGERSSRFFQRLAQWNLRQRATLTRP